MALIPFSRILSHWADKQADSVAIVHDGNEITWHELDLRTNQLARTYESLGVQQDDFVTIALPNGIEFITALFATWKLGATPQPVSPKLPKLERDAIVELANPSLVVGASDVGMRYASIPENFSDYQHYSTSALEERVGKNAKAIGSGGSTGRPKLIVMPTPAVWDESKPFSVIPHRSNVLVPGPLYHNGPFVWTSIALFQGNRVVLTTRFDAEQSLHLIEKYNVEHMYAVPTMMQRIWKLDEKIRTKYDLSSLQSVLHTAAPCPAWLKEAFIEWLGPSVVWELYGSTESNGSTLISGDEWLEHKGSVGRPMEGYAIKIFDEQGNAASPNQIGDIYMKPLSPDESNYEYIGAESNAIDDGWDTVGDVGYLDEDGYLYIADRRTDLIICGGRNIYPAEVEAAIDAYTGVRSSAVIGLPHEDLGSQVHAIVDCQDHNVSESDLMAFLQERLVSYKLPRSLELVSEPLRDDAGKVRRKALKESRIATMSENEYKKN